MSVNTLTGEITAPSALATLDPSEIDKAADPGAFVVLCLERSKTWLAEALDSGDIDSIVEMKSQAEAIRVYTVQKQLGKDSELAATEIVRRAERGIGVAIRRGQEAGVIRGSQDTHRLGVDNRVADDNSISPSVVAQEDRAALSRYVYPVTDGVSDEQFEAALDEAKAEQNLSRANVVRKVKGEPKAPLAGRHELLRNTRHHDSNRIVEQTVIGLEGYVLGIALIDFEALDRDQLAAWSGSLSTSLQSLNRLTRQLKELNQA